MNTLNCFLRNARSVVNKIDHLHMFLSKYKPDILFITETWLKPKVRDSEILFNLPYSIYRTDRNNRVGGGVCCLIRGDIAIKNIEHFTISMMDLLSIELYSPSDLNLIECIVVYRPPSSTQRDDELLIQKLVDLTSSQCGTTIILGDFNLHVEWNNAKALDQSSRILMEFFNECGYEQYVHSPTHCANILDIVLSTTSCVSNVKIHPPLASADHNMVEFSVRANYFMETDCPTPDFLKTDYNGLNDYLSSLDWQSLFVGYHSIEELYERFCVKIYDGLSVFGCLKKFNNGPAIRYPAQIESLIEQKRRLFTVLENPLVDSSYLKVCSDLNYHLKKFLKNHERRLSSQTSLKRLFRYMRNKLQTNTTCSFLIDSSEKICASDSEKAAALGDYFASVYSSPGQVFQPSAEVSDAITSCGMIYFHRADVKLVLSSLKSSCTEPYDGIPPVIYRNCAEILSGPLCDIFNLSMHFGEVPELWKEAMVTPIPKSSTANRVSEFRPISLLPTPIKVMEKIIRNKLFRWIKKYKKIPPELHGFVSGRSTTTNLVKSVFEWRKALNSNMSVDIIYVDLSKAFDKIPHEILMWKLQNFGISGKLLMWFGSYLQNRFMTVRVKQSFSSRYHCSSGVPQGGVLSPLLFLIFTFDLPDLLNSKGIKFQIYADDIKMYASYNEQSHCCVHERLQSSIDALNVWASRNGLSVNPDKCSFLHLGKVSPLNYEVSGKDLIPRSVVRDLGVFIDSKLDFTEHIDYVVKKAYSSLFMIFRNIHTTNQVILARLYKAYVVPHLEYCSQVWNPVCVKQSSKIEKVQRVFTRMSLSRSQDSFGRTIPDYKDRLRITGLKSLRIRRSIADLVFCFRILRKEVDLSASSFWVFMPTSCRHGGFNLYYGRLNRYHYTGLFNCLFYRCARWFRRLPAKLLSSKNSNSFKRGLEKLDLEGILNCDNYLC